MLWDKEREGVWPKQGRGERERKVNQISQLDIVTQPAEKGNFLLSWLIGLQVFSRQLHVHVCVLQAHTAGYWHSTKHI